MSDRAVDGIVVEEWIRQSSAKPTGTSEGAGVERKRIGCHKTMTRIDHIHQTLSGIARASYSVSEPSSKGGRWVSATPRRILVMRSNRRQGGLTVGVRRK